MRASILPLLAALAAGPLAAQTQEVTREPDRRAETFALEPQWTNDSGAGFGRRLLRGQGFEVTTDVSFRTAGFFASHGEASVGLGLALRLLSLDLRFNGALGVESGGGDGKVLDAQAFVGRTFGRTQLGLLSSLRTAAEEDESGAAAGGRDYELYAGPVSAVSLPGGMLLQGRLGLLQPARSGRTAASGVVSAIWGF